jgi:hypothetical protein
MNECAHRCCQIRSNRYHVHTDPPETCGRCAEIHPNPPERPGDQRCPRRPNATAEGPGENGRPTTTRAGDERRCRVRHEPDRWVVTIDGIDRLAIPHTDDVMGWPAPAPARLRRSKRPTPTHR